MAGLRPYALWDHIWVTQQVMLRRTVRAPHPLGRRRSLLERFEIRWRRSPGLRAAFLVAAFGGIMFGIFLYTQFPLLAALGIAISICCYLIHLFFEHGPLSDGRCIAAAHDRVRFLGTADEKVISSELADRCRWWRRRILNNQRDIQQSLISYSSIGRLASVAAFSLVLVAQALGPFTSIAAHYFGPPVNSPAARPFHRSSSANIYPVAGCIAVMIAYFIVRHRYLKRVRTRLLGCVDGMLCCDCGYEVESGRTFEHEAAVRVNLGPARCSECGCPWPLVPPKTMDPSDRGLWQLY